MKTGRPSKDPTERLSKQVGVPLTEEDFRLVQEAALLAGLTVPAWIRGVIREAVKS